ncbi:MAG: nucleotidyltransferase family protein [Clostridia bacterium]|nr:nucleotidyltransferase family protein [Clostridia bacterium]
MRLRAEIFAKGAIKILSSVPEISTLAFGCESGKETDFLNAAKPLINESDKFKQVLADGLDSGDSYIKSYAAAFKACGGDSGLLEKPNNVLGLEYTKAIMRLNSAIRILPIKRVGGGYKDGELKEDFSSAAAIRKNIDNPVIAENVPDFVYADLKNAAAGNQDSMLRHCLFKSSTEKLKRIYGCGEGLENRLKSLAEKPVKEIIECATSKRYSSSRIRRILCANSLELFKDECEKFLSGELYIKVLALKKERADIILPALAKSDYPLITDGSSALSKLSEIAKACLEKDKNELNVWNFINMTKVADRLTII